MLILVNPLLQLSGNNENLSFHYADERNNEQRRLCKRWKLFSNKKKFFSFFLVSIKLTMGEKKIEIDSDVNKNSSRMPR